MSETTRQERIKEILQECHEIREQIEANRKEFEAELGRAQRWDRVVLPICIAVAALAIALAIWAPGDVGAIDRINLVVVAAAYPVNAVSSWLRLRMEAK